MKGKEGMDEEKPADDKPKYFEGKGTAMGSETKVNIFEDENDPEMLEVLKMSLSEVSHMLNSGFYELPRTGARHGLNKIPYARRQEPAMAVQPDCLSQSTAFLKQGPIQLGVLQDREDHDPFRYQHLISETRLETARFYSARRRHHWYGIAHRHSVLIIIT